MDTYSRVGVVAEMDEVLTAIAPALLSIQVEAVPEVGVSELPRDQLGIAFRLR